MNIVIDENLPRALDAFRELGNVRLRAGRAITRDDLADADALIVRSITKVTRELLEGTPVRFVGTATNGLDHIDLEYLREAGIGFADISGSNANAVAEYVLAALLELRARGLAGLRGERLGVIGHGNIGSRVACLGRAIGMDVFAYDPPMEKSNPSFRSARFDDILTCDIISIHVPLVTAGEHPTKAMIDDEMIGRLRPGVLLLNTSRGGVVDSGALAAALDAGTLGGAVLDVWNGEPAVPVELIERVTIATPHIASYSADAKLKGTERMASALAGHAGLVSTWRATDVLQPIAGTITIRDVDDPLDALRAAVLAAYDINDDDRALRALLALDDAARRAGFDGLRKEYRERREFGAYRVVIGEEGALLAACGFSVA
ncbi:MAG: 4-phosphoerythronate dehydrogenase [Chlorobi bacterium]|nr:4-phosphoerythronate dehydrogenase [Chlorobiota bacterium]